MTENAVTTTQGGGIVAPMSRDQLRARLSVAKDETGANLSQFLTFSGRTGEYFVKVDNEKVEVPSGSLLALNILETKKGYTCWKDSAPIDEFEVNILTPNFPAIDSMVDHGPYAKTDKDGRPTKEGWVQHYVLMLKNLENNAQYLLKVSSESARRAVGSLIADVIAESDKGKDLYSDVAVIKIGWKEFTSGGHTNRKPTFDITDWQMGALTPAIADGGASAEQSSPSEKKSFMPKSRKG